MIRNGILTTNARCAALLVVLLNGFASPASAGPLVAAGDRALLTVSVKVEGSVEKPQGDRDSVVKWSTRRSVEATVELEAGKPDKYSIGEGQSGLAGAQQDAAMEMAKQAEACGEDQACLMRLAMQAMDSPSMKAAQDALLRYQIWSAAPEGNRLEVSGRHEETLHTVFYSGARETTDCKLTAPQVSPELTKSDPGAQARIEQENREIQEQHARGFSVEVDGVGKASLLAMGLLAVGSGDIDCTQNIGSGPERSHHKDNPILLPRGDLPIPLLVKGSAPGGSIIASGSTTLDARQELNNLGVGFATNVTAPLKVTVRWELKAL